MLVSVTGAGGQCYKLLQEGAEGFQGSRESRLPRMLSESGGGGAEAPWQRGSSEAHSGLHEEHGAAGAG